MRNKTLVLVTLLGTLMASCNRKQVDNSIVISTELNMEHKVSNYDATLRNTGGHSGSNFSSVDSVARYAIGYTYVPADSLKSKNLMVYISAWVRENEAPLTGGVAVALINSKGIQQWTVFKNKDKAYTPGQWVEIKDSLYFPSEKLADAKTELAVLGIKDDGKDMFDIDDLKIKYKFYK